MVRPDALLGGLDDPKYVDDRVADDARHQPNARVPYYFLGQPLLQPLGRGQSVVDDKPGVVPDRRAHGRGGGSLVQGTDFSGPDPPHEGPKALSRIDLQNRLAGVNGHEEDPKEPNGQGGKDGGHRRSPVLGVVQAGQQCQNALVGRRGDKTGEGGLNEGKADPTVETSDPSLLVQNREGPEKRGAVSALVIDGGPQPHERKDLNDAGGRTRNATAEGLEAGLAKDVTEVPARSILG